MSLVMMNLSGSSDICLQMDDCISQENTHHYLQQWNGFFSLKVSILQVERLQRKMVMSDSCRMINCLPPGLSLI